MKPRAFLPLCACACIPLSPLCAHANDGGIANGGSPKLLSGHPTVQMKTEHIHLTQLGNGEILAECDFVFVNHGKACTVRMGFPDEGEGAYDPDEEDENAMKHPPRTTFKSFASMVNGNPVTTKLIRADTPGHFWHTKTVTFPAKSTVKIRDVYTQRCGISLYQLAGKESDRPMGYASALAYVVHTGASWQGKIEKSEIEVTLPRKMRGCPPVEQWQVFTVKQVSKEADSFDLKVKSLPLGAVVWSGMGVAPTAQGDTLRFVRRNWKPTKKDDLDLAFRYMTMEVLQKRTKNQTK